VRTVGVEEELLLVDPETGEPQALSAAVLARAARDEVDGDVFEKELHTEMLEFATHPQSGMADLGAEIVRCRKEAARLAEGLGCTVAALASSPLPVSPSVGRGSRYQWMAEHYGITSRDLVLGCHVHVSVESDAEGVAVIDRIRPWLSVLSAISANSPFWQGGDTRYSSYRSRVWQRWPSAGPTELFGSAERYHRRVADMLATGTILDEKMVYFDARLSAKYPTIEIRISDACPSVDDAVLLAALGRALVLTAAAEDAGAEDHQLVTAVPHGHQVLQRAATWRAARSGLDGQLIDPGTGLAVPAANLVKLLLAHVRPVLESRGEWDLVATLSDRLLARGTSAGRQQASIRSGRSTRDLVADLCAETVDG